MTSESSTLGNVDATTSLLRAELPRLEEHQQELEKKLATVTERLESVRAVLSALQALSSAPPVPLATVVDTDAQAPALVPAARTEAKAVAATAAPAEAEPKPVTTTAPARRKAAAPAASRVGSKVSKAPAKKRKKAVPAQKSAVTESAVAEPAVVKPAAAKPATAKPAAAKPAAAKPAAAKPAAEKSVKAKAPGKAQSKAAVAAPAEDANNLTAQVMEVVAASGSTPVRARDVAEALGRELTTSSINTVRSTLDRLVATSRAGRAGRGLYRAPSN